MNWLNGLPDLAKQKGSVLSIGNFDGVHLGHQSIVNVLVTRARALGIPALILTFEPHPAALLRSSGPPPRLTTSQQKADLLRKLGVDAVLQYPTDQTLLNLTAREFFDEFVIRKLNAVGLVEGPNFFFGKGRSGDGETLRKFCEETGRFAEILTPSVQNGTLVSSSQIRQALQAGDVESATQFLGRPYSIRGTVVEGDRRGRTIGFPTANLHQIETLIPANGVYAARATAPDSSDRQKFQQLAAVSIGPNPTFDQSSGAPAPLKVEAHVLDFSGDLYGKEIELEFLARIRDLRKFSGAQELQHQIQQDIKSIRDQFPGAAGSPTMK
jgi:riboflavin kinase/FMN adenylyltransferase